MKCWHCNHIESDPPLGKLPFRSTCSACGSALHCCRNCVYYKPGLPNDCAVPGTEYIADRTATNFCEEFKLLGKGAEKKAEVDKISEKLFGEKGEIPEKDPKKRFDNLFD